jgi:triosephosphate isomerase
MPPKDKKLVVFNWKENPGTLREADRLFVVLAKAAKDRARGNVEIVACPPFIYLAELSKRLAAKRAHFSLGAQDVFWEDTGAYTGEIGPAMLGGIGKNIKYVIVGHSERRRFLGETDDMVNKKAGAALAAGFRVILCVGEPAEVRKQGIAAARQYIKNQLKKGLQGLDSRPCGNDKKNRDNKKENLIIAYEPIWAIGTGKNADPDDARDMAIFIKKEARHFPDISVLYGGSVSSSTTADYLCYTEINGVLVGGASLRSEEIVKMVKNVL